MKISILGQCSLEVFLRDYWQKKPLLIRNAAPDFEPWLSKRQLIELSASEEVQSRLVGFDREGWSVRHGPFAKKDFRKTPELWSLLVQGVNHVLPEAERLLRDFNFIPYCRLDDLMISFAPDGAGVGPHFDSYDVFLLQAMGRKRWQISSQRDMALVEGAPLRILKNFEPDQEWILETGDLLYLPPKYAHNGIAVGESMTYSIGFRAPSYQELAREFLVYLEDHLQIEGMIQDPDLAPSPHPAQIGESMLKQVGKALQKIRWDERDVEQFLGRYLSEPKPHLFFDPPEAPLAFSGFVQSARQYGLKLDLKSLMLFSGDTLFVNGEAQPFAKCDREILIELADHRELPPGTISDGATAKLLYEWYQDGYIAINKGEP